MTLIQYAVALVALSSISFSAPEAQKSNPVCSKNTPRGCLKLGDSFYVNDTAKALAYYQKGCDWNDYKTCTVLALEYQYKEEPPVDLPLAMQLFSKACQGGYVYACSYLADMYDEKNASKATKEKVIALYTKACEGNQTIACEEVGKYYVNSRKFAEAKNFFQKICDLGNANSCHLLAAMYKVGMTGKSVDISKADFPKALFYYSKACDGGIAMDCHLAGTIYLTNKHGLPENIPKAVAFLNRACDKDYVSACSALGTLHDIHPEINKDHNTAITYYKKACRLKDAASCINMGIHHERGEGVKQSINHAIGYYKKACDANDLMGCHKLASLYEYRLERSPANQAKAKELFLKTCDAGYTPSCRIVNIKQYREIKK